MSSAPATEDMIAALWAKDQIEEVMLAFGRALDRGDWSLYRRCFADIIAVDFERLTGFPEVLVEADLWVRFAQLALTPVRRHHQYSNFSAMVAGDHAEAVIYMVARHWLPTDRGAAENTQYGWYENRFALIDGNWKITRLSHGFQWISGNGALLDFSTPELIAIMGDIFAEARRVRRSDPVAAP